MNTIQLVDQIIEGLVSVQTELRQRKIWSGLTVWDKKLKWLRMEIKKFRIERQMLLLELNRKESQMEMPELAGVA